MKQIVLGLIGMLIVFYTIAICLDIYTIQTHKNQLEHSVSRAVEHTLENFYHTSFYTEARQQIRDDIVAANENAEIEVEIIELNLEMGILQVQATEKLMLTTGKEKELQCLKTGIMEKKTVEYPMVSVRFFVDGELYKEYQLQKGELCPMPRVPQEGFAGWMDTATGTYIKEIGNVWEDKVYTGTGH